MVEVDSTTPSVSSTSRPSTSKPYTPETETLSTLSTEEPVVDEVDAGATG